MTLCGGFHGLFAPSSADDLRDDKELRHTYSKRPDHAANQVSVASRSSSHWVVSESGTEAGEGGRLFARVLTFV